MKRFVCMEITPKNLIIWTDLNGIGCRILVYNGDWFSEFDFFVRYFIPGFDLLCNSRVGKRGGGVCIYVRNKYKAGVEPARLARSEALVAGLYFWASLFISQPSALYNFH